MAMRSGEYPANPEDFVRSQALQNRCYPPTAANLASTKEQRREELSCGAFRSPNDASRNLVGMDSLDQRRKTGREDV